MKKKYRVLYVDDDPQFRNMMSHVFKKAGHEFIECAESTKAVQLAKESDADCVITDLMMPGIDGLELVKRLRQESDKPNLKIIVVSSKSYQYDKDRAYTLGADGYILKSTPAAEIIHLFEEMVDDQIRLTIWGARGTLPVPGERSLRHGGNTACVSVEFPREHFFIFDAGTGLKELSDHLLRNKRTLTRAKMFISHPHWDHINAFPFFAPLYIPGNDLEVMGAAHGDTDIRQLLSHQMDGVYFPINIKAFSAHLNFRNLGEESFDIGDIKVSTHFLNHPGNCLGYRIESRGKIICYITDNEIYPEDCTFFDKSFYNNITDFVRDADVLIADCCYTDEEYEKKLNWGHSCPSEVCRWAHNAKVKSLYLFHHDPAQDDNAIDAKLAQATEHLKRLNSSTQAFSASEGTVIEL